MSVVCAAASQITCESHNMILAYKLQGTAHPGLLGCHHKPHLAAHSHPKSSRTAHTQAGKHVRHQLHASLLPTALAQVLTSSRHWAAWAPPGQTPWRPVRKAHPSCRSSARRGRWAESGQARCGPTTCGARAESTGCEAQRCRCKARAWCALRHMLRPCHLLPPRVPCPCRLILANLT